MITFPPLKLNKTVQESIPSPAELFARFGMSAKKSGDTTGDETPKTNLSKVEQLAEVEKLVLEKE